MRQAHKPGDGPFTTRTPRVSAALKLHRRKERDATGLFLAEGPQAVREALAAGVVRELFATESFLHRVAAESPGPEGRSGASEPVRGGGSGASEAARGGGEAGRGLGLGLGDIGDVSMVTDEAMVALAETITPQGVVAVCEQFDVELGAVLAKQPRLVAVVVQVRDPGNAGTILRTADAAGAGAVVFAGEAVDPYNGKCVRASAGSLFHVDVVRARDIDAVVVALSGAGLLTLATSGRGAVDLFELEPRLNQPTAWLFGGEAHGLPEHVMDRAERVRIPIYGDAESLNLAAAAAVCLYASARAQRSQL